MSELEWITYHRKVASEAVEMFTHGVRVLTKACLVLGGGSVQRDREANDREVQDEYRRLVRWNQGLCYAWPEGWYRP